MSWSLEPQSGAFLPSRRRAAGWCARIVNAVCLVGFPLLVVAGSLMANEAGAQALRRGDLSLGAYQSFAQYNRYWYHYNGATDCNGLPCSRANLNSYDSIEVPRIGNREAGMETSTMAITGLEVEYGLLERLDLGLSTQLAVVSSGTSSAGLGDTWISARWQATPDAPLALALGTAWKLPGTYDPDAIVAPGGGQSDLQFSGTLFGYAFRRRLSYNVEMGYRFRFPFSSTVFVTLSDTEGVVRTYPIVGPSDEVFLDFVAGLFVSRKTYLFLNGRINNAFDGLNIDDYYSTIFALEEVDGTGAAIYQVEGNPSDLLTVMEEDFVQLGAGVLFRVRYSATVYLNYSLKVLGQNTPAFYVPEGARIPVGTFLVGVDYTFGLPGRSGAAGTAARSTGSQVASASVLPRAIVSGRH